VTNREPSPGSLCHSWLDWY